MSIIVLAEINPALIRPFLFSQLIFRMYSLPSKRLFVVSVREDRDHLSQITASLFGLVAAGESDSQLAGVHECLQV